MLLNLMFHNIYGFNVANLEQTFEKFLGLLQENYKIVTPGDALDRHKNQVCLIFDDAYFDFFHIVYPLLKKMQIKVVLAIAVDYIPNSTDTSATDRLQKIETSPLKTNSLTVCDSLCSWQEIQTMVDSGLVVPASHTCSHPNLCVTPQLQREVVDSKRMLEDKLGVDISTLVLPYGRCNRTVLNLAKKHYTTVMRIGSALNLSWCNWTGYAYRINADDFWPKVRLPDTKTYLIGGLNFLKNSLRGR